MNWRRFSRFSIRTLLLLLAAVSIWFANVSGKARDVRKLTTAIESLGGNVEYTYTVDSDGNTLPNPEHPLPRFIRRWLGDYYFVTPFSVHTMNRPIQASDLAILKTCHCARELAALHLNFSKLDDESVLILTELSNVRWLEVSSTQLTERGLHALSKLPNIELLDISGNSIGDGGVQSLARMQSLRYLIVARTGITSEGLDELRAVLPNCEICIDDSAIYR